MLSLLKKLFVFRGDSIEDESKALIGSVSWMSTDPFLLEATFIYSSWITLLGLIWVYCFCFTDSKRYESFDSSVWVLNLVGTRLSDKDYFDFGGIDASDSCLVFTPLEVLSSVFTR